MIGYTLPSSVNVGGVDYPIRTDFRAVLDVLTAMNDADLRDVDKTEVLYTIMFPEWDKIPTEQREEALEKAIEFIDCGYTDDGKPHPRLVDWEQDAAIIVPAINGVAHTEVRALPYLHWWTFLAYYMDIGEGLFSTVLNIRSKRAEHKKLEKWEQEFLRKNRDMVELKRKESAEEKTAREEMEKWL